MATSISGDDIKTIVRYYADPAQPNIGDMRIVDLLFGLRGEWRPIFMLHPSPIRR